MKVHHVTFLVDLSNFKVVHFLDHCLELAHHFEHLVFVLNPLLSENTFKVGRNDALSKFVLGREGSLAILAFEDYADQQLQTQPDNALLLGGIDVHLHRQQYNLIKQA